MTNWIPGENPNGLAKPPEGFLRSLAAQDDQLVIFPSHGKPPLYRIARRTRRTVGLRNIARLVSNVYKELAPDTLFAAKHGLLPIGSVFLPASWGPHILDELHRRDTWAVGGGDKAADILDAQDKAKADAIDKRCMDELEERVNRSYESLRYRTGQRLSMVGEALVRKPAQEKSPLESVSSAGS